MLLHLLEDDADHLDQAGLRCVLVDRVGAGDVDVVERAHDFEEAPLMDRRGIGGHDSEERADYLELHVLVPILRRLADLVNDGVDEPPRKSPIALWLLVLRVEAIIWMVAVQQAVRHQLLNMVEDLLCKAWYLGVQRQLHNAEVLVRAEDLVVGVCLDLLDRLTAQLP